MLVIRLQQFEAFDEAADRKLRSALAAADIALSPDSARRINELIARAGDYGLHEDRHVRKYIGIVFRHPRSLGTGSGPAPAERIMRTFGLNPEERLRRLDRWASWIEKEELFGVD